MMNMMIYMYNIFVFFMPFVFTMGIPQLIVIIPMFIRLMSGTYCVANAIIEAKTE